MERFSFGIECWDKSRYSAWVIMCKGYNIHKSCTYIELLNDHLPKMIHSGIHPISILQCPPSTSFNLLTYDPENVNITGSY